ncbi:hypothetical protein D3C81_1863750 [compost metagenome]
MFPVRRDIDSHSHILVFSQVTFHSTRRVKRLEDGNALFFDGFYRGREFFGVHDGREQSEE